MSFRRGRVAAKPASLRPLFGRLLNDICKLALISNTNKEQNVLRPANFRRRLSFRRFGRVLGYGGSFGGGFTFGVASRGSESNRLSLEAETSG